MALSVGQQAPDFTLVDTDKKPRTLKEFLGTKTVLVFYPGAFTGVCTKEMCAIRDSMAELESSSAKVVGISVDSPFANKGFAAQNKLTFPLLSDYTRSVIRSYGIEHVGFGGLEGYAAAKRSVFVLDASGKVTWAWVSDNPGVEPDYAEVKKAAAAA